MQTEPIKTQGQPKPEKRKRQKLSPTRLAEKLKRIRLDAGLTQAEMLIIINSFESEGNRARVSQYERGERVPSIVELFNYSKYWGVSLNTLADDNLDLPPQQSGLSAGGENQNIKWGKPLDGEKH